MRIKRTERQRKRETENYYIECGIYGMADILRLFEQLKLSPAFFHAILFVIPSFLSSILI